VSAAAIPEPSLSDGVVLLRPLRAEDAATKATWGQDADIVRWTGVPAGDTHAGALEYIAAAEESRRGGRAIALGIVEAQSASLVGSCDIRRPEPRDPELGEITILLSQDARGRGLAPRALALLIEWGVHELGMQRIQAVVHPENARSIAMFERLGFEREGLLRRLRPRATGREDRILYALLADEWRLPATGAGTQAAGDALEERGNLLVITSTGTPIGGDVVRALRDDDQR
jgi:RimJ/RimL family protein N-acetyltransferase